MAARSNKRIFYANKQVGLKKDGDTGAYTPVFGVQSCGLSTNFNLEQFFEYGQIEIYANLENLPDVEVSLSKIIDGHPLIWHLATLDATAPDLAGRSTSKAIFATGIFPDTNSSAVGIPPSIVECSGLFPSNISYEFPVDGAFTESVSLVGNDKIWKGDNKIQDASVVARAAALSFPGNAAFATNSHSPVRVERREALVFDTTTSALDVNGTVADKDATILPPEVDGISSSGTNNLTAGVRDAHIQSISVSVNLGREEINELGRRGPYTRTAQFPTEVTCAIEAISTSGDMVSATEVGIYTGAGGVCSSNFNLKDRTIRIATCGGLRIYLGTKNKLSSVEEGGGDTSGGNVTNTYNFTTFNTMTVMAQYDPHVSNSGGGAGGWWANRATYLLNT